MELMARKKAKSVQIWNIMSLYSKSDMIQRFCQDIGFSNTWHEEDVILEPCSEMKIANMATRGTSSAPYFYFHLHVIHELGVLIPFTPFETYLLTITNVAPS